MDVGPIKHYKDNDCVERDKQFKYRGCWMDQSLDPDDKIKTRIKLGLCAFHKLKSLFTNRLHGLYIRQRFFRCNLWSVLLNTCNA